ncbi:hypothetical protein V8C42DRAFT_321191 [Trichoderma barbatum]
MFANILAARQETSCSPGTTFYFCDANKFRGCCSTDPCALHSCPDTLGFKDPKDDDEDDSSTISKPKSDEATPTPTDDDQSRQTESTTSSQSTLATKKSVTMTDSGITHTIPNNSIVTITRHTTITTGRPTTTTSDSIDPLSTTSDSFITESSTASFEGVPASSPTNANGTASPSKAPEAGPLSTGAIVGIAVGGAVLIAIAVVLMLTLVRSKKRRGSETDSVLHQDNGRDGGRDEVVEEKHFPHNISAHTTGTQASSDPFAPFGGEAWPRLQPCSYCIHLFLLTSLRSSRSTRRSISTG